MSLDWFWVWWASSCLAAGILRGVQYDLVEEGYRPTGLGAWTWKLLVLILLPGILTLKAVKYSCLTSRVVAQFAMRELWR